MHAVRRYREWPRAAPVCRLVSISLVNGMITILGIVLATEPSTTGVWLFLWLPLLLWILAVAFFSAAGWLKP